MADQSGDPQIKSGKKSSGWTDGYFEVRANTLIQAKNGIGSTITGAYFCNGADLFDVTYNVSKKGVWPFRYDYYTIASVTAIPQSTNIQIVNWDLETYAATIRIDIEESDNTTLVTEATSSTVKFATNFKLTGEATVKIFKIGKEFGGSFEKTETKTINRQYTLGSDPLLTTIVNFADKIVLSDRSKSGPFFRQYYYTREYGDDNISISVEPHRVQ